MRKKTQYIVVNEIYKTIYCGYPQKRAWKNLTTAEGGADSRRNKEILILCSKERNENMFDKFM